MNRTLLISFAAMFLGGLLTLISGGDGPSPVDPSGDVLQQSYANDKAARLSILDEMQTMQFETNGEAGDWFNSQVSPARSEAFIPFTDALAEAIDSDTIAEFTESIR